MEGTTATKTRRVMDEDMKQTSASCGSAHQRLKNVVEARLSVVDGRIALFRLNGRQPQSWFAKLLEGHERILGCDLDDPGTAPLILVIVEVMLHYRQKPCRGRRKQVLDGPMAEVLRR